MSLIERMARAIYEAQDNPVPWDSETLGDWRRDYEREKARAALAVVRDHDQGAVSREHAAQAIGWLSAEVAVHGAPSLGPEWLELWERALTATGGQ